MTEKQQNILRHALELFSKQGFDNTSTSKIAKAAGVSEGLIFRHFKNKDGLLLAIMENGTERVTGYLTPILSEKDPKKLIELVIRMPFNIPPEENSFWKLIYALKWQRDLYNMDFLLPLEESLEKAFTSLGYSNPKAEVQIIEIILDGVATAILLKNIEHTEEILDQILYKYNIPTI